MGVDAFKCKVPSGNFKLNIAVCQKQENALPISGRQGYNESKAKKPIKKYIERNQT
jgi:hypothetical protein